MTAAERAADLVAEVRDDPVRRMQFALAAYDFGAGSARYRPYGRAVIAFMRWQHSRGVLNPLDGAAPGSAWWRAVNEDLLRDTCEARILFDRGTTTASRPAVGHWLQFFATPSPQTWYLAHNSSVVAGYFAHCTLADAEAPIERFFMNVTLARVLYAQALVTDRAFALGRLAFLGRFARNPRLRAPEVFMAMRDILPEHYPIETPTIEDILEAENRWGRFLDYAVIGIRLDALYALAARTLAEPRLHGLIDDGVPTYAWPRAERHVWENRVAPAMNAVLGFFTRPATRTAGYGSGRRAR